MKEYSKITKSHYKSIKNIINEVEKSVDFNPHDLRKILRKYPRDNNGIFSRDQIITAYKLMISQGLKIQNKVVLDRIKMKPTRTISGVAPLTVLTKPYPCPGKCIYCPNDVRMPKSYLSSEPGAQRAARNLFDPYLQTYNRLLAFNNTGHNTDKVELIVLGGTWSFYPKDYRIWFIKRCLEAMNDFQINDRRDKLEKEHNVIWEELKAVQKVNEKTKVRNVGMVIETRPDYITKEELIDLRKLGVTKIQIGIQSLNDKILGANLRGHSVKESIEAVNLIRSAGFKIHIHWMPNLYKSNVKIDKEDYVRIWKYIMPDEMKIYPTSIIKNTELYKLFNSGKYSPYSYEELLDVLILCFSKTPRYCRLTRIVRDIPAQDIVAGNKHSNFRQIAENAFTKDGGRCNCIRCREIKTDKVLKEDIETEEIIYKTPTSKEFFISFKTKQLDKILGFLRLSLPYKKSIKLIPDELKYSAVIREVHVYGQVVGIGDKAEGKVQHLGLGKKLIIRAEEISKKNGFEQIAVISAIGTSEYYKKSGFKKGELYMHKTI